MLMVLLQRTPVLSVIAATEEIIVASPVGAMLKSAVAAVAALGAVNTLVGASPLTVSAGTSTGITVQTGTPMSVSFSLPGSDNRAFPTAKWILGIAIGSSFPPGLNFSGLTAPGTANVKFPQLAGTPTTAGVYNITLEALSAGNEFTSGVYNYTVTVAATNTAPVITLQPISQTVTAGTQVTFTANASGTPVPTFQWRKGNVDIPGATNTSYTIANVQAGNAGSYTFVATNSVSSATSNAATLTVNPANAAPAFTIHPQSQSITAGNPVTFTAAATGTPTPTFQWRKGNADIPGATNTSYTIAIVQAGDAGSYTVVATNLVNSATSNGATLTVNVTPAITAQPQAQGARVGAMALFSVTASGTPAPTYQWQRSIDGGTTWTNLGNDSTYAGVATNTLTVSNVTPALYGYLFRCMVTNSVGSLASNSGRLTVLVPSAEFNGDGLTDLLWQDTLTGLRAIWLMNGLTIGSSNGLAYVPVEWRIVATGDFNGDGQTDIVWENTVTGVRAIWLMNGQNIISSNGIAYVPIEWHIVGTGDFNGDGQTDIVWENTVTGVRAIWLMNGENIISSNGFAFVPVEWRIVGIGDFNGDGMPDIVWENTLTGIRAIWLMNGENIISSNGFAYVPIEWHIAATGDFNADGKVDLVWENTVTGDRAVWLMNGFSIISSNYIGNVPVEWSIAP